jgi:regulator of protease activity HflC (stomatin/prohibitin superfamily)
MSSALEAEPPRSDGADWFLGSGCPLGVVDEGFDDEAHGEGAFAYGEVDLLRPQEDLLTNPPERAAGPALLGKLICIGAPYCLLFSYRFVKPGMIGTVKEINGTARVLKEGLHLADVLGASEVKLHSANAQLIEHGTLHIVRVPPGFVGLATSNARPLMLAAGRHVISDPLFVWRKLEALTAPHITNVSVHLITVPAAQLCTCMVNGVGHFLGEGVHRINNPRFVLGSAAAPSGFVSATTAYLYAGKKHRVLVPAGKVALCWRAGAPIILEARGTPHFIDDALFSFERLVDVGRRLIIHGSIKIITVRQGVVGVVYDDGRLAILAPGRVVVDRPTYAFAGFLPCGQRTLTIAQVTSLSADNVPLRFDAAITVRVMTPLKAVTMLGMGGDMGGDASSGAFDVAALYSAIQQKSRLALSTIIGNNAFSKSRSHSSKAAVDAVDYEDGRGGGGDGGSGGGEQGASGTGFKQHIHDVFLGTFATSMLESCGVAVIDMSIEDIQITSVELGEAMARAAVAETHLEMARIERRVTETNAAGQSSTTIIAAEAAAKAMALTAHAEASRIKLLNEALSSAADITQRRELIRASGEILATSGTTIVLGQGIGDVARALGGGGLDVLPRSGGT